MSTAPVTAAVLIIGNEILSGRTRDANLQYIATGLEAAGIQVKEARVVRDEEAAIVAALDALRAAYHYVFTTGGIGPTHDDITAAAVAKAFRVPLLRDPDAVRLLQRQYSPEDLSEARLSMADIPQGAELIENPVSQAPGFRIGNVFVLAGVPRIMQSMLDGLLPRLKGGMATIARSITIYVAESVLAPGLREIQGRHAAVEVGSYPFFRQDRVGSVIVVRGFDAAEVERTGEEVRALARALGAEPED